MVVPVVHEYVERTNPDRLDQFTLVLGQAPSHPEKVFVTALSSHISVLPCWLPFAGAFALAALGVQAHVFDGPGLPKQHRLQVGQGVQGFQDAHKRFQRAFAGAFEIAQGFV